MHVRDWHGVNGSFGLRSTALQVLVGLPGSGKSTVGRQLARRLQVPFADSDQFIERRIGCPIRDYFVTHGESEFRELEVLVIDELTLQGRGVLSTGGGSVLLPANRQRLRARGYVIYLHSTPDELYLRLRSDTSRPLLQVADPLGRLKELYSQRDPLYRETAHFVVETGRPSVSTLVNTIFQLAIGPKPSL